jgi:tetratricopeptide (TPR) repeat protein
MLFFRVLLPAASVAVLVYGVPMIKSEYFCERARVAVRDDHPLEGFAFAQRGLETEKNSPELYYYCGEAALQAGISNLADPAAANAAAIDAFSKGLEIFPQDSRLAVKLGQAYAGAGDYFESSNAVSQAEEMDPNSAFVYAYRGIIEYAAGYYDDAERAFQSSIELGGEGAEISKKGLDLIAKVRAELDKPGNVPDSQIQDLLKNSALDAVSEAPAAPTQSPRPSAVTPDAAVPATTPSPSEIPSSTP